MSTNNQKYEAVSTTHRPATRQSEELSEDDHTKAVATDVSCDDAIPSLEEPTSRTIPTGSASYNDDDDESSAVVEEVPDDECADIELTPSEVTAVPRLEEPFAATPVTSDSDSPRPPPPPPPPPPPILEAKVSHICGWIGVVLSGPVVGLLFGVIAIVLGTTAMAIIRQNPVQNGGISDATRGTVLGCFSLFFSVNGFYY